MKIKQYVFISDPKEFIRGDYDWCFALKGYPESAACSDWTLCGEIELDVNIDTSEIIAKVSDGIEEEIEEITEKYNAAIHILETRKRELLSLTHQGQ